MLRYKLYAIATHPLFLKYSYFLSYIAYLGSCYVLFTSQWISMDAFVSENALTASSQTSEFSMSDCGPWVAIPSYQEFLTDQIKAQKVRNYEIHSYFLKASRAPPSESIVFLIPLSESTIETLNIYRDFIRYTEKNGQ